MKINQYEWDPEKDKLGEGTFAEVFKAKDVYANRNVALKIYKIAVKGSTTGSTGQSKYSLEQEFQKIQDVSHTNIITYYGLNYIKHIDAMGREASHPAIVMEYANQGTLTEFLRTKPERAALDKLISDIILGVGHLHEEGIIHRDLKPGNILVTKNKRGIYTAKITDFGISKDTLSSENLTKPYTEMVGTPHYMAPEQIYQKQFGLDGRISTRTDLWAIGVIIYKVFTGKLPFGNNVHEVDLVRVAISKEEFDLTNVPKEYHKLLKKCFQKNAGDRVSNANLMFKLIDEEETVVESKENDNYLGKTVTRLGKKDVEEGTVNIVNDSDQNKNEEGAFNSPTKTQKIVLAIFGIVNILWFGYFWFSEENTPYVYLVYPLTIILFCFFYLRPNNRTIVPKFLVYGLIMYFNILFLMFIYITIFENTLESKSILTVGFGLIFQVGLSIWLIFKKIRKVWEGSVNTMGLTGYLLSTSLLVYLISYFLNIYHDITGSSTVFLISDDLTILTLLPNVFFTTALLFFVFKKHRSNLWFLLTLFIASVGIASIWWLMLDSENGYKISLIGSVYMQELEAGYYLWFLSIFISFSVILYDAFIASKAKKMYWPILGVFILALGVSFYAKWSTSENVYNFNRGVKNVDYNQFKKAFDPGKPLKVSSYEIKNFVKKILTKYTNENAGTVKSMLQLFVNSNGEVTYIEDADLASAITKNDPELLEILLKPTGSTKFGDVDFVDEDKSLLQLAQEIGNKEIEKLLVDAGAKLTAKETQANAIREKAVLDAKKFNYFEDFTNVSKKFAESSNDNATWSYEHSGYKLYVKNMELSHYKTARFDLNVLEPYTVSVRMIRGIAAARVGLVFDSNGSDYHVAVVGDKSVILYKNEGGKWNKIKEVFVTANKTKNTIKIRKNKNYISCYLNDKIVISNQLIKSTNGNYFGVINTNPNGNTTTYFDNFQILGTKK